MSAKRITFSRENEIVLKFNRRRDRSLFMVDGAIACAVSGFTKSGAAMSRLEFGHTTHTRGGGGGAENLSRRRGRPRTSNPRQSSPLSQSHTRICYGHIFPDVFFISCFIFSAHETSIPVYTVRENVNKRLSNVLFLHCFFFGSVSFGCCTFSCALDITIFLTSACGNCQSLFCSNCVKSALIPAFRCRGLNERNDV